MARARVEVRLEEDEHTAVRRARPRASPRSRPDGARSRRSTSTPAASPRRSSRRPAPANSASAGGRPRRAPGPRARARQRAQAALRRLCSPAHRERSRRTGAGRRRARPRARARATPRRAPRPRRCEANVVWWSRSTFVTTAIRGRSAATVRSDSSPSTTSQPSPVPALPPSCGTSPPISQAGSRPSRARQKAIIAAVVVLPCAPATTIASRSETSSASSSARLFPSTRSANALDTYDLPLRRRRGGSSAISTSMPSRCSRYGVSHAVPAAHLGAPRVRESRVAAHAGTADAGDPEAATVKRRGQ